MLETLKDAFKDVFHSEVEMVIIIDTIENFKVLATIIKDIELKWFIYEVYKEPFYYMLEIKTKYSTYLKMMSELQKEGYNLRVESKVGIINNLIKYE